jgi:hypothetical protein
MFKCFASIHGHYARDSEKRVSKRNKIWRSTQGIYTGHTHHHLQAQHFQVGILHLCINYILIFLS